jgi:MFS family permease
LRGFDRNFKRTLLAVFLFTLGNSTDAFLLVRAQEVGVPVAWLPMLWCVFNLLKSSLSVLVGGAIDRYGAKRLLLGGWLVYMVAYLGFAHATELWHILVLFVVYSVFYALTEPSERALVASLCDAGQRGLAFGWFNTAIGIAALPASLMFGYLYEQLGPLAAFGFGSAMALCAALILFFVKAPAHAELIDGSDAKLPT